MLYRESETNATELLQSLSAARMVRKEYYNTLHEYNVLVIEYEALTGS